MLIAEPMLEELLALSTPFNVQGSTLPTPVRNMDFRWSAGGAANGHMWVAWQWAISPIEDKTFYRPDGSTVNLKQAVTQIPNAVAPTLAQVAGGALGARTRYVRTALVKDGVLYMGLNFPLSTSGESSLAISANNLLKVTSPAAVAGFDGWCPLVGTNVSQEVTQPGTFATPIAFGTDWTEPVGGAQTSSATNTLYGQSSQWDFGAVVFVELNVSTDYFFYPYYDPILGFTRWLFEAPLSGAKAAVQYGDGNYPLTNGSLKGTTPIATGTNTGSAPTGGGTGGNVKILT